MSVSSLSAKSSLDSLRSSSSIESAPDRLAPAVEGPMAWKGVELNPAKYVLQLDSAAVAEVRSAVISFKRKSLLMPCSRTSTNCLPVQNIERGALSKKTFPLSAHLSSKLASVSKDVHQGLGVAVLRGLDAARFNDEEAVIAFVGICAHAFPERATDSYANQTLSGC